MAKFYQHINSDDPLFQKTTKLLYVDDSDPDLLMYNFDDGTKCSAEFIAKIDDTNANNGMYHMVEVESPVNIWRFKPVELKAENITAKTAEGQEVEVPDPYFIGLSGNNAALNGGGPIKEGTRWESRSPRPPVRPIDDVNEYFGSYIKYAVENNVQINKDIDVKLVMDAMSGKLENAYKTSLPMPTIAASEKTESVDVDKKDNIKNLPTAIPEKNSPPKDQEKTSSVFQETKKQLIINADDLINSNDYDIVKLTYNGEEHEIDIKKFFAQSVEEQKIIEVETKHDETVILSKDDIEIDIINTPEWGLVNNMINMSQKEDCTIDMELVLSLPPVDVYKLIKTAYPKGLSDAFVKTIANRMPIKDLRLALAKGLFYYYDAEPDDNEVKVYEEDEEDTHHTKLEEISEKKTTPKKQRTKKSKA